MPLFVHDCAYDAKGIAAPTPQPSLSPAVPGAVAVIGNFDGVHRGHQALIAVARRLASEAAPLAAITFEPHPRQVFRPQDPPFRLTVRDEKLALLAAEGIGHAVVIRFDPVLASLSPDDFVAAILAHDLGVKTIVVGQDFVFGRGRSGDVAMLAQRAAACGIQVVTVPSLQETATAAFSLTRIRACLKEGDVAGARAGLGRPWRLIGPVVAGDRLGRQLGFPTANLDPGPQIIPAFGAYAVDVTVCDGPWAGTCRRGVANIGHRPTVNGASLRVEAHMLDFAGDLYGARLALAFRRFLRPERRFPGLEALQQQIARDIDTARQS